jgi:EpsI family protein
VRISVPGEAEPITINRYVVSRDQSQGVVLYWYQGHNRVVASEYRAKLFTILDSIRYQQSDTSLVRVVVDASDGNVQRAVGTGISFVQAFFLPLKNYLPA